MAKTVATERARLGAAGVVRRLTRAWGPAGGRGGPREFQAHARMAVREGLLAVASLCEDILQGMEEQARRARRRVERIPVTRTVARTPRTQRTRRRPRDG